MHARIKKIFTGWVQLQTRVGPDSNQGRSNKVLPFQNPYQGKLRGDLDPRSSPSGSRHGVDKDQTAPSAHRGAV